LNTEINSMLPEKDRVELTLANLKADRDSKNSFYDIATEQYGAASSQGDNRKKEVEELDKRIAKARNDVEKLTQSIKDKQRERDALEQPLTQAIGELKQLLDNFDRQVNLAVKKQWGIGDFVRGLPVIDGFAPPTKIEQYTINDLTIDYNFK